MMVCCSVITHEGERKKLILFQYSINFFWWPVTLRTTHYNHQATMTDQETLLNLLSQIGVAENRVRFIQIQQTGKLCSNEALAPSQPNHLYEQVQSSRSPRAFPRP